MTPEQSVAEAIAREAKVPFVGPKQRKYAKAAIEALRVPEKTPNDGPNMHGKMHGVDLDACRHAWVDGYNRAIREILGEPS